VQKVLFLLGQILFAASIKIQIDEIHSTACLETDLDFYQNRLFYG